MKAIALHFVCEKHATLLFEVGIELRALKLLSIEGIGHKQHVLMLLIFHDGPGRAVGVVGPVSSLGWSWRSHSYRKLRNLTRPLKAFCGLERPPVEKSFNCLEDINKIANIQWF